MVPQPDRNSGYLPRFMEGAFTLKLLRHGSGRRIRTYSNCFRGSPHYPNVTGSLWEHRESDPGTFEARLQRAERPSLTTPRNGILPCVHGVFPAVFPSCPNRLSASPSRLMSRRYSLRSHSSHFGANPLAGMLLANPCGSARACLCLWIAIPPGFEPGLRHS